MPVIGIPVDMLLERIASKLSRDQLIEHLQHLGCDVEGFATNLRFRCQVCDNIMEITQSENAPVVCDRCGADFRQRADQLIALGEADVIRMELLAVRPDMFDPGGLARVLRHYLEEQAAPARYELGKSEYVVHVDPALAQAESFRPAIACAVVRGLSLDDDKIKVVMKLQENLHWALGRDRKHASIGVYDLDSLGSTTIDYRAVEPDGVSFVPLGYNESDPTAALTPARVLEEHTKGQAYARLLGGYKRYPLLIDRSGVVLSMPPIINSENTRVRRTTRNFFVDVTGSGPRIVNKTLNILVTALAELDAGAKIEQVTISSSGAAAQTPDLSAQVLPFEASSAGRLIGVDLDQGQVKTLLGRMGHDVSGSGEQLEVRIPAYRNDIMHPVDLIEDVAIAYGYHNIAPTLITTMTVGQELPTQRAMDLARRALIGLGYFEVMTLILSSAEQQYDALSLPRREDAVLIDNPISVEQTQVRSSLLPGLLDTFAANADHEMPQLIFEVGNVSVYDAEQQTGARERCVVAAAAIGPRIDYAHIRSTCEALVREFAQSASVSAADSGLFIPGRGANVGIGATTVGLMGEVHPQVLERFKLIQPVALFELDLAALAG